jgi:NitT/TauT family transport system ATP-binding protein
MSKVIIRLNNINKSYPNGKIALENVNLNISESEFISIVGPSGCGKSTLLRLVSGLSSYSSGDIYLEDNVLHKSQSKSMKYPWSKLFSKAPLLPRSLNKIAFVFQDAALMPWTSVLDNVLLPLKLAKVSNKFAKIEAKKMLDLVGLTEFENAYPRELSGGMKMRVSLARALVTNPSILLMDEPFGSLDEITRSQLNQDLLNLWKNKNWTVLFVTHNIYEAVYLSERVIVMSSSPGRIIADVSIDIPYPRSEIFRTSELYGAYCKEVLAHLSLT